MGMFFGVPINSVNITNNNFDITQRDANGNLLAVERTQGKPVIYHRDLRYHSKGQPVHS